MNISRLDTPCVEQRGEARRGDGGSLCVDITKFYSFSRLALLEGCSSVWGMYMCVVCWCPVTCYNIYE